MRILQNTHGGFSFYHRALDLVFNSIIYEKIVHLIIIANVIVICMDRHPISVCEFRAL